MNRNTFVVYFDWEEQIECLTERERARLFPRKINDGGRRERSGECRGHEARHGTNHLM